MLYLLLCLWVAVSQASTPWQRPPDDVLAVLDAPGTPEVWHAPGGEHLLLVTPVRYPPLADRAAPMHKLAGLRVDPRTNSAWGVAGHASPAIQHVADGRVVPIALPDGARVLDAHWSADGERVALIVRREDHVALHVADTEGRVVVPDVKLNPLLGSVVRWLPDQRRLVVKRVPAERGAAPAPPPIPPGPMVLAAAAASPSSTYEARDLLQTPHEEALFTHFTTSRLAIVDAAKGTVTDVTEAAPWALVAPSPDGKRLLVERLTPPWSYRVAWRRFASEIEVRGLDGRVERRIATQPLAEQVPIHGVPEGPRDVHWRSDAPATLVWTEALDGGDPGRKAPHRDRLMALPPPYDGAPTEIFRAAHRVESVYWGARGGLFVVEQYERERRWRHVWLADADDPRAARSWFDLSANERYADPGDPVVERAANGAVVLVQDGDALFFAGAGATPHGERPFLDRRSIRTGRVERLFRGAPDAVERFVAFVDARKGTLLVERESPTEPPNLWQLTLGAKVVAGPGEATRAAERRRITSFVDPTPQLRGITQQIVTYTRDDGVPLSFKLYLPPGHEPGTRLPTVLYAYPREFSDPGTAGQVAGTDKGFLRFVGPTHLFFLLRGYAVLHNTTMPVLGDPDTAYDTFVEQLVANAKAAVDKAVELGVTDPDRVGVMGHSHGALMTATLLAHSDLFKAGIARSGAHNHTIRPFGFQSERRTLWQAQDTYVNLSPVMHAPKLREPLLIIHGAIDENPGTVPLQSQLLFEAIRGTGGTARLVMLPYEGHGYVSRESVEHVLWEQLDWFDRYVKGAPAADAPR